MQNYVLLFDPKRKKRAKIRIVENFPQPVDNLCAHRRSLLNMSKNELYLQT